MEEVGYSAKALSMMKKMGYEEGKGLGKELQGPAETLNLQSNTKNTGLAYQAPPKHGLYSCRSCTKVFNHIAQVNSHIPTKQHQKKIASLTCPVGFECLHCGIQLIALQDVILHDMNVPHTTMTQQNNHLKCDLCGISANSEAQWSHHINGAHHMEQIKKHSELQLLYEYSSSTPTLPSPSPLSPSYSSQSSQESSQELLDYAQTNQYTLGSGNSSDTDHESKRIKLSESEANTSPTPSNNIMNYPPLNSLYYSPTPIPTTYKSKFFCTICNIPCNSQDQYQAHLNSNKHQAKSNPPQIYHCATCNLGFNSPSQLNAHFSGKKHLDQVSKTSGQPQTISPPQVLMQPSQDFVGAHPTIAHPLGAHPSSNHTMGAHPPINHPLGAHPPINHPPGAHPSINHPLGAHPSVNHPFGAHPPITHPPTVHPSIAHPLINHPLGAYLPIAQPLGAHPSVNHPLGAHPSINHPPTAHPPTAPPLGAHPSINHPLGAPPPAHAPQLLTGTPILMGAQPPHTEVLGSQPLYMYQGQVLSVPQPQNFSQDLSCHICNLTFNSLVQKQSHEAGRAHASKLYRTAGHY